MQRLRAASLGLLLAWSTGQIALADGPTAPVATLGKPVATLGKPQALVQTQCRYPSATNAGAIPPPIYGAGGIVLAQAPDGPPPPVIPSTPAIGLPPAGSDAYNCGVATTNPDAPAGFFAGVKQWCKGLGGAFEGNGRKMFQSDHSFDGFISPVSNPFYFEDPRSLTELRPVFIFQNTPSHLGGNIFDFTLQGRLAITDNFSIVINKLGFISASGSGSIDDLHGGSFEELWLGPKYTFLRCESTGTVAAAGLTFELPVGGSKMAQDTGSLSLDPYVSIAQRIYRTPWGTINGMGTLGYSARTDNERSDHLYSSLHFDFDVGDLHRIYPLLEMNWFHYTRNGKVDPLNVEGRDLINFGSTAVAGENELSMAAGARFKINDAWQIGVAAEFPITSEKGLMNFRIGFDMIFRY